MNLKLCVEHGHFSVKKYKEIIGKEFYIPKLEKKIQKCISCCIPCIVSNRKQGKQEGELHPLSKDVAIKWTQLGPGLKLRPKYLGPYRIVRVKLHDTYDVTKESVFSEGPRQTSTCAEYLKPWIPYDDNEDDAFLANTVLDGRFVGLVWQRRTAGREGEMESKTT